MPATTDATLTNRARQAIAQVLEERPELRDSKRTTVEDLMLYLEVEEGSEEWLPHYESNSRALSALWRDVIKNGGAAVAEEETAQAQPVAEPEKRPTRKAPASPSSKAAPKPRPASNLKAVSPKAPGEEPAAASFRDAEKTVSDGGARQELAVVEGEIVPGSEEQGLTAISQAVAEQFAIVQYREQMLARATHDVEQLTQALAQAKQQQSDAAQAYANALEDLARLLATSLGSKAVEFGKLFSRVATSK